MRKIVNVFQKFQPQRALTGDHINVVKWVTKCHLGFFTVQARLGSPTATSTFDPNIWFYISQVETETSFLHPRVTRRDVVAIAFDESQNVASVNKYTLADGRVIAINDRETPTRGREMTILEQLVGNIGRGGMLPPEQSGPGERPDDQRPH